MTVGIIGLGLIGGSLARAYAKSGHSVLACETNENILSFAQIAGVVSGELKDSNISQCDLILLAVYSECAVNWLKEKSSLISPDCLVIDCCGTKVNVCAQCFLLAEEYGFTFVGGHPMAGSHNSGFKYSRANLFQGAPMVLVPARYDDASLLERISNALAPCGFGTFSVTTAEEHDRMIAFTSQMPHIISNAYIKSPTAQQHKGFSAGSYKDLTRVAWLNPQMWSELLLSNKNNILNELDYYIASLQKYRDAIESDDKDQLTLLLEEGRNRKKEVDG